MKKTELLRKRKLNKKVSISHLRGKQFPAHFDLQQVLDTPFTNIGELFYKRILPSNNPFIANVANTEAHCFFRNKTIRDHRTNEIATDVHKFCLVTGKKGDPEVKPK